MPQTDRDDQENKSNLDISHTNEEHSSDNKMLMLVAVKFLILFVVILTYDILFDLLHLLLEHLVELIHLLLELIEEILDSIMGEILPTTKHQNEVIMVNMAIFIMLYAFYKLLFGAHNIFRLKSYLKSQWLNYKERKYLRWKQLSLISKIKLISAYCAGLGFLYMFAF